MFSRSQKGIQFYM